MNEKKSDQQESKEEEPKPRHPHYRHIPDETEIAVARAKFSNWDWWNDDD